VKLANKPERLNKLKRLNRRDRPANQAVIQLSQQRPYYHLIMISSLAQEQKARRQIKELKEINQTGIFWQIESENGKICNKRREVRWHPPIKRNF